MKVVIAFAITAILSASAAEAKCTYNLKLSGLRTKKAIPASQKLEVLANLRCNTVEVYDIKATAQTGDRETPAGSELPLKGKLEVDVRVDQIDELTKHFPSALLGMDMIVQFKVNALKRLALSAAGGFLSPGANSGIALFETDYGNAKTKEGRPLFDPRQLAMQAGQSAFTVENENFALSYQVTETCQ